MSSSLGKPKGIPLHWSSLALYCLIYRGVKVDSSLIKIECHSTDSVSMFSGTWDKIPWTSTKDEVSFCYLNSLEAIQASIACSYPPSLSSISWPKHLPLPWISLYSPSYPTLCLYLCLGFAPYPEFQPTDMRSWCLLGAYSLCIAQSWSIPGSLLNLAVNGENSPNLEQLHITLQPRYALLSWTLLQMFLVQVFFLAILEPTITFKHRVSNI